MMVISGSVRVILLVAGLVVGGCSDEVPEAIKIQIDPEDMGPACAGYTACTNTYYGIGACVNVLYNSVRWDLRVMSFNIGTFTNIDWINTLAGCQNAGCMAEAQGDCDRVLACMNQGKTVRGCTPPEGYFAGRYCVDENILAACTETGRDGQTIETSLRCNQVGMDCVEIQREQEIFAACGHRAADTVEGISVTCDGTLARIQEGGAFFRWDCALMNADCQEGSYASWDNYDFCLSDHPACDPETTESYCYEEEMIVWCNGREIGLDCSQFDQVCDETRLLMWISPMCSYTACNPFSYEEKCERGEITYCGPEGETMLSCNRLGYSSCELAILFGQCRE